MDTSNEAPSNSQKVRVEGIISPWSHSNPIGVKVSYNMPYRRQDDFCIFEFPATGRTLTVPAAQVPF